MKKNKIIEILRANTRQIENMPPLAWEEHMKKIALRIDSLYSGGVSEKMCEYCRKPSKPFYDSELKVEICLLCKAYWKSHPTPENSGGVSKLSIVNIDAAFKLHTSPIDSGGMIWHKACKWTEDQLSHHTPETSEEEIQDTYDLYCDRSQNVQTILGHPPQYEPLMSREAFMKVIKEWTISKGAKPIPNEKTRLNRESYEQLINQDIDKILTDMKPSLERDHIIQWLRYSVKAQYERANPVSEEIINIIQGVLSEYMGPPKNNRVIAKIKAALKKLNKQ